MPTRAGKDVMDHQPAIVLEHVEVKRGSVTVLRDINLRICRGSITAVIGASGAGKTTLLRVLNGGQAPWAGQVSIPKLGSLSDSRALRDHRRQTATIYQDYALIGRLSALDNVLLGLADQRQALLSFLPWPKDLQLLAAQALDEVGLIGKALTPVSDLSGGERQRVAIARALVRQPRLIVADEPFASVDPALVDRFSSALREAVERRNLTIVIALHQVPLALRIADMLVGLANGTVALCGPASRFIAADLDYIYDPGSVPPPKSVRPLLRRHKAKR